MSSTVSEPLQYGTARGRAVLLATILGSGMTMLDGTVVSVALPAIGRDLHAFASVVRMRPCSIRALVRFE